jgi:hypothetical protein
MEKIFEIPVTIMASEALFNESKNYEDELTLKFHTFLNKLEELNSFGNLDFKIFHKIGALNSKGKKIFRIALESTATIAYEEKKKGLIQYHTNFPDEFSNFPYHMFVRLQGTLPISGSITKFVDMKGNHDFDTSVKCKRDEDTFAEIYRFPATFQQPVFQIDIDRHGFILIREYKFQEMRSRPGISITQLTLRENRLPLYQDKVSVENWLPEATEFLVDPVLEIMEEYHKKVRK